MHRGTLQLLYSGHLFSRPALLWCHNETLDQTIAVKRAVRSLIKGWVHTYVCVCVYIYMYIRTQNHGPWEPSSRWHPGTDASAELFQSMRHFLFKFCCALVHGDGPSVTCNSRIQGTFQKYTSTTFQLSSGTHGQLLVLAVCPWFAGEHQRVKRKDGDCGLAEQPDFARPILKTTWTTFAGNLAVKHLRQNYENLVGGYKQLE